MKRFLYIIITLAGLFFLNSCENKSHTPDDKGELDGTTWQGIGLIGSDRNVFVFANNQVTWSCYTEIVDTKYTYDYRVQGSSVYIGYGVNTSTQSLAFRGTLNADTTSMEIYYYGSGTKITIYRQW